MNTTVNPRDSVRDSVPLNVTQGKKHSRKKKVRNETGNFFFQIVGRSGNMPLGQVPDAHFQCLAKSLVARQVVRIIAQCSIFPATYLANAAKHRCETNCTKRVTLGNVSCNLSHSFVATKVTQLNCLLSHPATDISRNFFFSTTMFSNINIGQCNTPRNSS